MSEEKDLAKDQKDTTVEQEQTQAELTNEDLADEADSFEADVEKIVNDAFNQAAQEADEAEEEEVKVEAPVEPTKVVIEENIDFKDKYYRLSAEFDNYRKRTLKEKMEYMKNASGDILGKLIPVIDNFERALKAMETAQDVDAVKQGIDLIYGNFADLLKQNGVKEIEALNAPFDVDLHEALTKIPAPSEDLKGKVVDVIEKGYKLNDKVIRYAKVVIGE